jgi:hypothetical protein
MNKIPQIEKTKGKTNGWPETFEYLYDEPSKTFRLELNKKHNKKHFKEIDPWCLAAVSFICSKFGGQVDKINITINKFAEVSSNQNRIEIESLRRRLSFLKYNNDFNLALEVNGVHIAIYDFKDLLNRPPDEVIRVNYKYRSSGKMHGNLEKDLQGYLFGYGINSPISTNERLAIFGDDFYRLNRKHFKILREFPTGAFIHQISSKSRILPTEFIDLVTVNKWKSLAIIELKINDVKLDVMSQSLNYALFITSYWNQIQKHLNSELNYLKELPDFTCYIVNNRFHTRFHDIWKYYKVRKDDIPFKIKPVILGYYL